MNADNEVKEPGGEPEVREASPQSPTQPPQEPEPEPDDIWAKE